MKIGIRVLLGLAMAILAVRVGLAQAHQAQARAHAIIQRSGTSYLGIGAKEVSAERVKELNLKEERGVEVDHVEDDGPAAKAGMKEHDVVLEYNGEKVEGTDQLIRMVQETPAGRQAKVVVWRNGASHYLVVDESKAG